MEARQDESAIPIGTALFLDVYSQKYSMPLVRQTIAAEIREKPTIQDYREYTLPFTLDHPTSVEFRVETTGYAHVLVDKIDVQPQLPARLHHALASVYLQQNNYEAAYEYLTKALKDDVDNSTLHMKFLTTLLALERWEEAHQFLTEHGFLSNYHTGLITFLDPERVGNTLPESLQQIYATNLPAFVPEYPVEAQFADKLSLLGYDLQGERIAPGGEISVSYYWKALEAMDEDYVIFVHFIRREHSMLDPETVTRLKRKFGRPITDWFQQDHEPLSGAYPTSQWIPGELVREDYIVAIPPGIEPGEYEIWLGVWNPLTETRLSTAHEKNKVRIGTFWIDE
jgi:hypothetical protein